MVLTRRWKVNVSIEPSVISDIRMFALIISRLSDEIFSTLELCSFESQVPIHIWFLYVYFFDLNALVETTNSRQMLSYRRKKSRPLSIYVAWFYILLGLIVRTMVLTDFTLIEYFIRSIAYLSHLLDESCLFLFKKSHLWNLIPCACECAQLWFQLILH